MKCQLRTFWALSALRYEHKSKHHQFHYLSQKESPPQAKISPQATANWAALYQR